MKIIVGRIYFASIDRFQNMFVYQPSFNTIKYKNNRAKYVIGWKSR